MREYESHQGSIDDWRQAIPAHCQHECCRTDILSCAYSFCPFPFTLGPAFPILCGGTITIIASHWASPSKSSLRIYPASPPSRSAPRAFLFRRVLRSLICLSVSLPSRIARSLASFFCRSLIAGFESVPLHGLT